MHVWRLGKKIRLHIFSLQYLLPVEVTNSESYGKKKIHRAVSKFSCASVGTVDLKSISPP